jgi:hypothetical protein
MHCRNLTQCTYCTLCMPTGLPSIHEQHLQHSRSHRLCATAAAAMCSHHYSHHHAVLTLLPPQMTHRCPIKDVHIHLCTSRSAAAMCSPHQACSARCTAHGQSLGVKHSTACMEIRTHTHTHTHVASAVDCLTLEATNTACLAGRLAKRHCTYMCDPTATTDDTQMPHRCAHPTVLQLTGHVLPHEACTLSGRAHTTKP